MYLARGGDARLASTLRQQIVLRQRRAVPRHDVRDTAQRVTAQIEVMRMVAETQPVVSGQLRVEPDGAETVSRRLGPQPRSPPKRTPQRPLQPFRHTPRFT